MAATYVAFFWGFKYVPTQDGPVHLSTAVVLESLLAGEPLYADYYELDLSPAPYWAYHGVTASLLTVFPPLVAEKIFLSLYVVAFAAAAWYFTKAASGAPFPLAPSGFYGPDPPIAKPAAPRRPVAYYVERGRRTTVCRSSTCRIRWRATWSG